MSPEITKRTKIVIKNLSSETIYNIKNFQRTYVNISISAALFAELLKKFNLKNDLPKLNFSNYGPELEINCNADLTALDKFFVIGVFDSSKYYVNYILYTYSHYSERTNICQLSPKISALSMDIYEFFTFFYNRTVAFDNLKHLDLLELSRLDNYNEPTYEIRKFVPNLESLTVSGNNIRSNLINDLCLQSNLKSLEINDFDNGDQKWIYDLIHQKYKTLECLSLHTSTQQLDWKIAPAQPKSLTFRAFVGYRNRFPVSGMIIGQNNIQKLVLIYKLLDNKLFDILLENKLLYDLEMDCCILERTGIELRQYAEVFQRLRYFSYYGPSPLFESIAPYLTNLYSLTITIFAGNSKNSAIFFEMPNLKVLKMKNFEVYNLSISAPNLQALAFDSFVTLIIFKTCSNIGSDILTLEIRKKVSL